jgi:hypothetical protein
LTGLWRQSGGTEQNSVVTKSTGLSLQNSRTVDLAYALIDKKEYPMARQLFEKIIKDGKAPLDIMDAERGLEKLAELDKIMKKTTGEP